MSTSIGLLPLYRAIAGVQSDEDWALSLAFYLADGVTPISLAGISFAGALTPQWGATISLGGAQFAISGASSNILTLTVLAAAKAAWGLGAYQFTILASDGVSERDLLGNSTLTVGAPQVLTLTPIVAAGGAPGNLISYLPAALTPAALLAAAFSALPNVQRGAAVPAAGQPYVNQSGYVVIAQ